MLRLHDHHVEPSLLAKFNKQRGNTGSWALRRVTLAPLVIATAEGA